MYDNKTTGSLEFLLVTYIESDKARGNQFGQALLQGKPYITTYELLKKDARTRYRQCQGF